MMRNLSSHSTGNRVVDDRAPDTSSELPSSPVDGSGWTIPTYFAARTRQRWDRVALRHKKLGLWCDVTWNEYHERVQALTLALRKEGLHRGDRVAIIGGNCPEWVMIDLAVQCAGGVSVGVYTTNAWQQCRYVVHHSDATFLFVENEEQLDKWLQFRSDVPSVRRIFVWDLKGLRDFSDPLVEPLSGLIERGRQEAVENPHVFDEYLREIHPDDTAIIVYTSGTTGTPKGAQLSHRNVLWVAESIVKHDPVHAPCEDDEVMSFLPLCHIFERLFSVVGHVVWGHTVSFVESQDAVSDNLRELSPTIGYGVPRFWEKFASYISIQMDDATWFKRLTFGRALGVGKTFAERKLTGQPVSWLLTSMHCLARATVFRALKKRLGFDRMRLAYSGAAPAAPDVVRFFHAIGIPLTEGYGQTESAGVISIAPLDRVRLGSVGLPLPGLDLRIADDGEILVRSPGVFLGYLKDPERSARTVAADGWLHTGDVGSIDDDGFVRIIDRKKDLIITAGGKNIAPQWLENKLKFCPYVQDAVVIGDQRKFLSALIVLDEDNVVKYAQDNKVPFSTYADLADDPDINVLIQDEINRVNDEVARVQRVRAFRILPNRLYEEDGDVTPTMKVKRAAVLAAYSELIESMYAHS